MTTLRLLVAVLAISASAAAVQAGAQSPNLKVVVIQGEGSINIIQQKTAVAPIVEVRDRNDQPVGGAVVRFAIQGERAAFEGGLRSVSVTTNASGRATVQGFSPTSSGAVEISVNASFQGLTATATILQTNFATAAAAAASSAGGAATAAGGAGAGGSAGGGIGVGTIAGIGAAAAGAIVGLQVLDKVAGGGVGDCFLETAPGGSALPLLVPAAGGSFNFDYSVTCTEASTIAWTVSSDSPWLTFPAGTSFADVARVAVQIAPNPVAARRTAGISIETEPGSGSGFGVTQEALGAPGFVGQAAMIGPVPVSSPTCASLVSLSNLALTFAPQAGSVGAGSARAIRTDDPSAACASPRAVTQEDFVLDSSSISGSGVTLRFRSSGSSGRLPVTLSFRGTLAADGQSAVGSMDVLFAGVGTGDRTVTVPMTLTVR